MHPAKVVSGVRLRLAFAVTSLLLSAIAFGCTPERSQVSASSSGGNGCTEDKDNDGFGVGCALGADCNDNDPKVTTECRQCLGNEPGCPCAAEGKRIECGKLVSKEGNESTCIMGGQLCREGRWSGCEPGAYGPGHDGYVTFKALGSPGPAGSCADCDPNCHLITDTLDGLDAGPDSGILPDGGITFPNYNSPGPTPEELAALSSVDGGFEGGIFHTMIPGQITAVADPVNVVDPRPAGGDVYFLIDDTSSMGPVAAALRDSIALQSGLPCIDDIDPVTNVKNGQKANVGGGIVENLKCKFGPDVFIGLGRFEDYAEYKGVAQTIPAAPYESLPFQHILSVQETGSAAQAAATYFGDTAYNGGPPSGFSLRTGGDIPESLTSALFAASTGYSSTRTTGVFWVPRRPTWTTPWAATPLAADLTAHDCTGYPCWRPQTTPIFVIMTDAPSHNGPGGQYGYPQYTPTWTTGAVYGPNNNEAPNLNASPAVARTFAAANELEYETDASGNIGLKPRLYAGTVLPNFGNPATDYPSNSSVGGGVYDYASNGNNGRRSIRDCNGSTTVTVTGATATTVDFGNYDIPWPDAAEIKPPAALVCGGVTYDSSCGTGSPHASSTTVGTYAEAAYTNVAPYPVLYDNVRISVGGNTVVRADGANAGTTTGYGSFVVPTAGSRVEFRVWMLDDAQIASPTLSLLAGPSPLTLTPTAKNTNKTGFFYTTTANQTIQFGLRTTTPNVIARVEYWVRAPILGACGGFITYSNGAAPLCVVCASGYAQSGLSCCGNDSPRCTVAGTIFAPSNATGGGCPAIASPPQAAITRGAAVLGDCVSCAAAPKSAEANAPQYVRTIGGNNNPGCYVPTCATSFNWPPTQTTTKAGGAGWSFASGGRIAANGSGKCVRDPAELDCAAGAPICTNFKNLCNALYTSVPGFPVSVLSPTTILSPPAGTTNTLCGCSQLNGGALETDHPVVPASPPANGVLATYFRSSPGNGGGSYGFSIPQLSTDAGPITRYETQVNNAALPAVLAAMPTGANTNYSARWTGKVRTPCTGNYQFASNTDDGGRLWIDGNLVAHYATNLNLTSANPYYEATWHHAPLTTFSMTAASKYNMKLEMFQGGGGYGAVLYWKYTGPGPCTGTGYPNNNWNVVPSAFLTPDYDGPSTSAATSRAQCLTQGRYDDTTTKSKTLGDGGWNAESIYKFTVPAGKTFYYHFALIKNDQKGATAKTVSDTHAKTFLYLKSRTAALAGDNTPVLDCNKTASPFSLDGSGSRGVIAEINGRVGAGDYYLVIDNYETSVTNYTYLLQVNQFETTLPAAPNGPTAATYPQAMARMQAMGARTIGVENSGVSCSQAHLANIAQYETREHLEKLAYDTGSLDENGVPIVVSLKQNAQSCGRDPVTGVTEAVIDPPLSLTAKMNAAVNTLANTLRQDLVIRATTSGAAPSPDIDPANAAFVAENFMATVTADASTTNGRCGAPPTDPTIPATGPDFDPSFVAPRAREMFNSCLPGAPVKFNVRFTVPASIHRTDVPQYFRFDLTVAPVGRDANGNKIAGTPLARIPVVIKVPPVDAGTAGLTRDYDAESACVPGQRPLWDGFGYNASTPDNNPGSDSSVKFYFSTADDVAGLAPKGGPGETLLATATRIDMDANCFTTLKPKAEVCARVDLRKAMIAAGFVPNKRFTRIRIEFAASQDFTNVPTLIDWKMFLDCIDSE